MTPAELARVIRKASDRMTGSLILEPIDDPAVREALAEARSKGLAIVLLDTPLPSTPPAKPLPCVAFAGFDEAGKAIVDTLKDEAAKLKLPNDGTALVLANQEKDVYSNRRQDSLIGALKAAGISYDILTFDGESKGTSDSISAYLDAHPKVTIIVSDDDFGLGAIHQARSERKKRDKPEVVAGGYAAGDERAKPLVKQGTEVMADCSMQTFGRKVLDVALDLMAGKPVPERIDVEMPLIRKGESPGPRAGVPQRRGL